MGRVDAGTSKDSIASATLDCHWARRASRIAFIASCVFFSFSRMNIFLTFTAFS